MKQMTNDKNNLKAKDYLLTDKKSNLSTANLVMKYQFSIFEKNYQKQH